MNLETVTIENPDGLNFILGMSHFIMTVEDMHEAIVKTQPGLAFGLAFVEASGPCLVRKTGNSNALTALAVKNAMKIGAGHSFIIFMDKGFPINILNSIKMLPEVCRIFCATANPVEVVIAHTRQGRGILGCVDGLRPAGVEQDEDIAERKHLLRTIGYKL